MNTKEKIENAAKVQLTWKNTRFEDRQALLADLANILEQYKEQGARLITKEMNKPISQSRAEIAKCALMCRYYATLENVLLPQKITTEFAISEYRYEPKGVILGVMPWNFPFWQVLRFAIPTLLVGNSVLLKHASICFESGDLIQKLIEEAGFPVGLFQNLRIGHSEVEEVLSNPLVQGVSLTGSEKAGSSVASAAGKYIKKSVLELGGSDAFIVLNDADLQKAAEVGALARLQNCGQTCIAAKRFLVQDDIYDQFLAQFVAAYQKYIPKDPMKEDTLISGMARPDLADELASQYQLAIANGAEAILPLERISENEFRPGIIKVNNRNPILKEEVFGPLALIMNASTDQELLELANDIPFGLANSVWTNEQARQDFFINQLQSGTVSINKLSSSDPRLPFGGVKNSGYGVELSTETLSEFVNIKTVLGS